MHRAFPEETGQTWPSQSATGANLSACGIARKNTSDRPANLPYVTVKASKRCPSTGFVLLDPLALLGSTFNPVLVHGPTASIHASFPHSVALMRLHFTSFVMTNLVRDLQTRASASAERTKLKAAEAAAHF